MVQFNQFDVDLKRVEWVQVFGWKKKILELRQKLEKELEAQIIARADRRELWRSSSPFSAEVIISLITNILSSLIEIYLLYFWKSSEGSHILHFYHGINIKPPTSQHKKKKCNKCNMQVRTTSEFVFNGHNC